MRAKEEARHQDEKAEVLKEIKEKYTDPGKAQVDNDLMAATWSAEEKLDEVRDAVEAWKDLANKRDGIAAKLADPTTSDEQKSALEEQRKLLEAQMKPHEQLVSAQDPGATISNIDVRSL